MRSDGIASVVVGSGDSQSKHRANKQGSTINPIDAALANNALKQVTQSWNGQYDRFLTVFA
jgi:hypothetical protein